MDIKGILLIIFILVLLYIILRFVYSKSTPLSLMQDGKVMTTVQPTNLLGGPSGANSSNFTYSVWFYVNDWNYRYGETKVIFGRMASTTSAGQGSVAGVSGNDPCPSVTLGASKNDLSIALACYPGLDTMTSGAASTAPSQSIVKTCTIANVPVQKWVNLLISIYGRSMDAYIDGKLVKTCLLPGVAKINNAAPIYVTPSGGFSGWTSKLQYFPNATDPQTAWNIYSQGYGGNGSGLFQYRVKVAVYNGNNETGSLTI
jgi:hypothetical protein